MNRRLGRRKIFNHHFHKGRIKGQRRKTINSGGEGFATIWVVMVMATTALLPLLLLFP
jgi:hypothetical protein